MFSQLLKSFVKRDAGSRSARRVRLNCESLEGREVPAANLMGVNLSGVEDWSYDRLFADAMKSARRPSNLGDYQGTPPIDAKGWPASDASIVVWQGITNMNGTYHLSFTGQADFSTSWGATSILNKSYNAATNTTTADIVYLPTDTTGLLLNFKNTRRTSTSALNTGVTNIQLMRPVSPGSTTYYDPSATFTQPIKNLVSNFSVIRMMDDTGSNGGPELNGNWNLRRPADYASQAAIGIAHGMSWEYAIQLWNETNKDAWVNIPFTADDNYVRQLATLIKNNLKPGLKVYVEYSNELWNTAYPFPGNANHDQAVADVKANPSSPLNFDGIYPSTDTSGWELARRRIALRSVQVSNIFRDVFGSDAMMSRVRPVLMSQLGWTDGWLTHELDYVEDYFDNPTYQASPLPASYYFYGAGGSAYEDPNWSNGANTTVDQIFNTMPNNFVSALQSDQDWVAAFGLKRIAYEGGPALDNVVNNGGVPTSTLQAAWSDPRMETELVQNHNTWSANGGDLLMYFASTGGPQWGLVQDTFSQNTYKMKAIADLNAAAAAPVTYGKLAPFDLLSSDFGIPGGQGGIANMAANSLTQDWNGAHFRVDTASNFKIRLSATASNGGKVEIFVDGKSLGVVDVPSSGDTATLSLGTLLPGEHGIILRARAGTFSLSKVSLATDTAGPPAGPASLTASSVSSTSLQVKWSDQSGNETGFVVQRATNSAFTAGLASFNVAANTTQFTDTGLTPTTIYYYRVQAVSAAGGSAYSNTASAVTSGGNGLTSRLFDNMDFTGNTLDGTSPTVDYYWPGAPATGFGMDQFSVRWTGWVQAVETGSYVFRTNSDDGVRLWINGIPVVNNWTNHSVVYNTTPAVSLTAGQRYEVRMEFYDNTGGALTQLQWERPGQTTFVDVPQAQLYPAMAGPVLFADSFDSGLGNWGVASGYWGAAATYAGRKTVDGSSGRYAEEVSWAATSAFNNAAFSAWVDLTSLTGSAGLIGRSQDSTHYYLLEVKKDSTGSPAWFLESRAGATWKVLASGRLGYTAGSWLKLRLTMSGTSLLAEASSDGTSFSRLGAATDSLYASGRVGFRSTNVAAYFDDAMVQGM